MRPTHFSRRLGVSFLVAIVGLLAWQAPARADSTYGSIVMDRYAPIPGGGGLEIVVHYTTDPDALCPCPPDDLRWLQVIHLTDNAGNDKTTVPGFPKATFIDPQPGQTPDTDDEPWYEYTYANNPLLPNPGNFLHGQGAYLYDRPNGWGPFAPVRFDATTILVCIDPDTETAKMLGGFSWGFSVTANPFGGTTTTMLPLQQVQDSAALRSMFNDGPGGMEVSYDWSLAEQNDPTCVMTFDASAVPTPTSLAAIPVGLVLVAIYRRGQRVAA